MFARGNTIKLIVEAQEGPMLRPVIRAEAEGVAVEVVDSNNAALDAGFNARVRGAMADPKRR